VLLSTHVLAEVEGEADRIAIMEQGLIRAMGTPEELRQQADLSADASLEDVYLLLTGRERRSAAALFDAGADIDVRSSPPGEPGDV
jgi:ABC-2 type transport system ATP-binding protein